MGEAGSGVQILSALAWKLQHILRHQFTRIKLILEWPHAY